MTTPASRVTAEKSEVHTPGPWEMRPRETTIRTGDMYAAEGFTSYVDGFDVFGPEDRPIVGPNGIPALEADECNAILIASSPDLLSIAKRWNALDANWDPTRYANEKIELLDDTREVIAKAEGRS